MKQTILGIGLSLSLILCTALTNGYADDTTSINISDGNIKIQVPSETNNAPAEISVGVTAQKDSQDKEISVNIADESASGDKDDADSTVEVEISDDKISTELPGVQVNISEKSSSQ